MSRRGGGAGTPREREDATDLRYGLAGTLRHCDVRAACYDGARDVVYTGYTGRLDVGGNPLRAWEAGVSGAASPLGEGKGSEGVLANCMCVVEGEEEVGEEEGSSSSSSRRRLWVGTEAGEVVVFALGSGERVLGFAAHVGGTKGAAGTPDGRVWTVGADFHARKWGREGAPLGAVECHALAHCVAVVAATGTRTTGRGFVGGGWRVWVGCDVGQGNRAGLKVVEDGRGDEVGEGGEVAVEPPEDK